MLLPTSFVFAVVVFYEGIHSENIAEIKLIVFVCHNEHSV